MSGELQTNAADERQIQFARRKAKRDKNRKRSLLKHQLSSADGREFVWNELERHGIYEDIAGPVDIVYARLGRRSAGLQLLGAVMEHPELYLQMQAEAIARKKRDAEENDASRTPRVTDATTD